VSLNDISAVVATRDYATARAWYSRIMGRDPDLEPIAVVAEWQITATAWLQLIEDADRAGKSAVRFGVNDLAAQIAELNDAGIATGEPVVIADMVKVVDVADPDGNEVSFVQDLTADSPS
jgi:catechol 2,3-dioxygenase-like lactoylglutathione lyase family enzyme